MVDAINPKNYTNIFKCKTIKKNRKVRGQVGRQVGGWVGEYVGRWVTTKVLPKIKGLVESKKVLPKSKGLSGK